MPDTTFEKMERYIRNAEQFKVYLELRNCKDIEDFQRLFKKYERLVIEEALGDKD